MNGPIRRLAVTLFAGLAVLLVATGWIQGVVGPALRDDPGNPRVLAGKAAKERGVIVDRGGRLLAQSIPDPADPATFERTYPLGALTGYPVGYTTLIYGDSGIEAAYSSELRSKQDLTISDLIAAFLGRDLQPRSLELTLDTGLQDIATEALAGQSGAVVALDPKTGAVLAYVSAPGFDPAAFASPDLVDKLTNHPDVPLLDRVVANTYPPGSTFKLVVAAAAIESGLATPDTTFENPAQLALPGSTAVIRNFDQRTCGSVELVSLKEALRRSCNTIFGLLGMNLGAEILHDRAEAFGFNSDIPFEWEVLDSVFPSTESLDPASLAQSSIGQRDVQATPLQMALVVAAIANDGIIMRPYLVERIYDTDGQKVVQTEPRQYRIAISAATARILAGLMEQVVASGTGTNAAVPGVRIAGKTGTAETERGAPHAWFVGFGPVEDPSIVVAVVVEDGGFVGEAATGGSVAAPIAKMLFEHWLAS